MRASGVTEANPVDAIVKSDQSFLWHRVRYRVVDVQGLVMPIGELDPIHVSCGVAIGNCPLSRTAVAVRQDSRELPRGGAVILQGDARGFRVYGTEIVGRNRRDGS